MYVREQQMRDVGQPCAALLHTRFERLETRAWSRIDERQRSCALNDTRRNRMRTSEKIEIDPRHARRQRVQSDHGPYLWCLK